MTDDRDYVSETMTDSTWTASSYQRIPIWKWTVRRLRGMFLLGVVLPWWRWDIQSDDWEFSFAFGYWIFAYRIVEYRETHKP